MNVVTSSGIYEAAKEIINKNGFLSISPELVAEQMQTKQEIVLEHAKNKHLLLDLIQDEFYCVIINKNKAQEWKKHLREYALAIREELLTCPGMAAMFSVRPSVAPSCVKHTNMSYKILKDAGFNVVDADFINHSIAIYALGITLADSGILPGVEKQDMQPVFPTEDYMKSNLPHLYEGLTAQDWTNYMDNIFKKGIDAMVEGYSSKLIQT